MNRPSSVTLLAAAALAIGSAPTSGDEPAGTTVLNNDTFWRWRVSWRTPIVPLELMKAADKNATQPGVVPVQRVPFTSRPDIEQVRIPPPPPQWCQPDFDDSSWPRSPVGAFGEPYFQAGTICLRGKFHVSRPKAVASLKLSIRYRGGVVAYLNGREVARRDMPGGAVNLDTPASPYPPEAWVDAQGKPLPKASLIAADEDMKARAARRDRTLAPLALPTDALREGVNVLAVAVHRADYHPAALTWFNQQHIHASWRPIRLESIELSAVGKGVRPNVARPRGAQVWNADMHERLRAGDYGDPNEPLRPVRVVGARNGTFNGCVVVSSDGKLSGVTGAASDLKAEGGASIPASAVEVLYVLESDGPTRFGSSRRDYAFDLLSPRPAGPDAPKPPRGAATVQPVWLRIRLPANAAPGEYRGELKLSADGMRPVVVPVELRVTGWTLPDPLKFRTHAGIYQSPTSLAMQYKVQMWSQEHWGLIDRSFALLARAGNDLVVVPVVDRTQFGNDEGMVRWVRRPDGKFDYDFTVLDRYLATAKQHLGVPTFVALQVWHAGGWKDRGVDQENTVTVVDATTKQRRRMQVPTFATPDSQRFWAAALAAIRRRLGAAGMARSACLGILSDSTAPPEVFTMFAGIAPEMGWMRGCHGHTNAAKPYPLRGGGTVVYHEHCYGMTIPNPAKSVYRIWDQHGPPTAYFRSDFDHLPPRNYRAIPERGLYQGKRGFGRMGLDYWDFPLADSQGRRHRADLFNRWPISSCAQRRPTLMKLAGAGADGPAATVRYELLLEGLQEAEAMIVIAQAVDTRAAALGRELTERCRRMWLERLNTARVLNGYSGVAAWDHAGWQDASRRLYDTAAQVAARLRP